ncbi:hypothetical protein [Rhodococcus sp. 06-235-1A]|uniref:hypothetical protein n=1 Tax=Rhodococcus sp. 06-235-1A TaxID=2022508 RepID=UPI0015C5E88D|nr:hypothetical protein [Rhodococcus sp. 06-235-1A]
MQRSNSVAAGQFLFALAGFRCASIPKSVLRESSFDARCGFGNKTSDREHAQRDHAI